MVEECVRCLNALYSGGSVGAASSSPTIQFHRGMLLFTDTF
jgi:hypothetical protein